MQLKNLLTDVAGLRVGHAQNEKLASGVTVVVFDEPAVAGIDVRGGGPGTRETALLEPALTVPGVDALVLSGGSAFGLDAASGVQAWLAEQGRGFRVGNAVVPIVPGAILFDLLNGGDKAWGRYPPYRDLAYAATASASHDNAALGTVGAGFGATTVNLKGGLGTASAVTPEGHIVSALAAVNACGSANIGDGPWFWAAPLEDGDEFGGRGMPNPMPLDAHIPRLKGVAGQNTTLVIVATDAVLNKAQANRLAVTAQSGMSRSLYPVHTPLDGDVVFAAATGKKPFKDPLYGLAQLGAIAGNVVARAIARGVHEATALPFTGALPDWKTKFRDR